MEVVKQVPKGFSGMTLPELFDQLGWKYKTFSRGYLISCPNKLSHPRGDVNPSCAVWAEIGRFRCYSCGYRGELGKLFENTGLDFHFLPLVNPPKPENIVLDEAILDCFRLALPGDLEKPAFQHRNWPISCLQDHDLRFDDRNGNLVFPVRSPELVGAVGRSATGKQYHNYFGISTGESLGGYSRLSDNPKIAVVEGWTCLVNCYQWAAELGFDVVCTFTANVTPTQARLLCDSGKVIHFWYDQDKAGRKGVEKAEQYIGDVFFAASWDSRLGDIGSMSRDTFLSVIGD